MSFNSLLFSGLSPAKIKKKKLLADDFSSLEELVEGVVSLNHDQYLVVPNKFLFSMPVKSGNDNYYLLSPKQLLTRPADIVLSLDNKSPSSVDSLFQKKALSRGNAYFSSFNFDFLNDRFEGFDQPLVSSIPYYRNNKSSLLVPYLDVNLLEVVFPKRFFYYNPQLRQKEFVFNALYRKGFKFSNSVVRFSELVDGWLLGMGNLLNKSFKVKNYVNDSSKKAMFNVSFSGKNPLNDYAITIKNLPLKADDSVFYDWRYIGYDSKVLRGEGSVHKFDLSFKTKLSRDFFSHHFFAAQVIAANTNRDYYFLLLPPSQDLLRFYSLLKNNVVYRERRFDGKFVDRKLLKAEELFFFSLLFAKNKGLSSFFHDDPLLEFFDSYKKEFLDFYRSSSGS